MTPGPDLIFACPACAKLFSVSTIGSGNTFGAVWWTDGKYEAPMLPERITVGGCPHCATALWVEDATQLGKVPKWGPMIDENHPPPREWTDAPHILPATDRSLAALIARERTSNRERLAYLRIKLWWLHNDAHRKSVHSRESTTDCTRPAEFTTNLRELLALLKLDDHDDRIVAAELHRELGAFAEAVTLLQTEFPKEYADAAARIRQLAERRDPIVALLPS